jgi:hypothetical protein
VAEDSVTQQRVPPIPTVDGRSPRLLLSDRPQTGEEPDYLGFRAYADALAELIDNPRTDTPLTIAISAEWGAGKTSLAKMVEQQLKERPRLRGDPSHVVVWFNAWMHDDAEHLGAAFAADVAMAANAQRPRWRRLSSPLPTAMLTPTDRWRRRLGLGAGALIVAALLATAMPGVRDLFESNGVLPEVKRAGGARFGSVAVLCAVVLLLWGKLFAAARAAASFVDDPRSEASRGSMDDVSKQLGALVAQATRQDRVSVALARRLAWFGRPRRFVVLVDDLERCRPPRALEVCEVASQLLAHPNVVTILIADMSVVAASAAIKYADLEGKVGGKDGAGQSAYGRAYLEKMVQLEFEIPPPDDDRIREMLRGDENRRTGPSKVVKRVSRARDGDEGFDVDSALRAQRWLASFGKVLTSFVGVVVTLSFTLGLLGLQPYEITLATFPDASLWLAGGALLLAAFSWLAVQLFNVRARRRREAIDRKIREAARASATAAEFKSQVLGSDEAKKAGRKVSEQALQHHAADQSAPRRTAEAEILKFLPTVPRRAKRMLNRLRVLLVVAEGRSMIGEGTPELSGHHLGRWIVLNERWPDLARSVGSEQKRLQALEQAEDAAALRDALADVDPQTPVSAELLRFMKGTPNLAPVLNRLVHLEPADRHPY